MSCSGRKIAQKNKVKPEIKKTVLKKINKDLGGTPMIFVRQDRPGLVAVDFSQEPGFDPATIGSELALGLFTVEGGPKEIIAEDSGQLGHILDYIYDFLTSRGFAVSLDNILQRALSLFREESSLVRATQSKKTRLETLRPPKDYGIRRSLLQHQLEGVRHALSVRHSANFSVPGSGKSTTALSVYAILRKQKIVQRLLVIGPASSFAPWESEFKETFGRNPSTVRLIGARPERARLLRNLKDVDLILCTYQMAYRERENLISSLQLARYLLILDEAHHIKNINLGPWARTVLDLASYAERRMILTGTPAPRALQDLWSQFTFLWPSQSLLGSRSQFEGRLISAKNPAEELKRIIKPFFIRTKKSDLGLPKPVSEITMIAYRNIPSRQKVIVRLLEQRTLQEAKNLHLSQADLSILRRWRKSRSLRLLQAASNPRLLAAVLPDLGEFGTSMDDDPVLATLLHDYYANEIPAKVNFVVNKVRQLVGKGKKVVIWATFVENLLLLERLLEDLNPLKVYGDVPAYNEDDDPNFENREQNISDFKSRDDRPVLIANPAACSESVSLHMVCQNAIYLERTFNCGQFLQSMDRIHRVGMPPKIHPHYHIPILQCAIEQVVDRRLRSRQQVLYRLLDDDMPVLGYEEGSFLLDREDDLEEIFRDLLEEITKSANKRTSGTSRRSRSRR